MRNCRIKPIGLILLVFAFFNLVGMMVARAEAGALPRFETHLLDSIGLLAEKDAGDLASLLAEFEAKTGNQFLVAILPSLPAGESLEGYALKVAEKAQAGQKGMDNGLLLLVFRDDRTIRIEVGTGLEEKITDGRAGRVIRQILAPAFQEENYAGGISEAMLTLMRWAEPSFTPSTLGAGVKRSKNTDHEGDGFVFLLLFIVLFFLSAASSRRQQRRLYKRGYSQGTQPPVLFPPPVHPFGRSSGNFPKVDRSGFGNRGGFRGGGGGFRGGGASGGW